MEEEAFSLGRGPVCDSLGPLARAWALVTAQTPAAVSCTGTRFGPRRAGKKESCVADYNVDGRPESSAGKLCGHMSWALGFMLTSS